MICLVYQPVAGLEQQYAGNQYNTGSRLIIISQAIGDKRVLNFFSSGWGWDLFESLMKKFIRHVGNMILLAWRRRSVTEESRSSGSR